MLLIVVTPYTLLAEIIPPRAVEPGVTVELFAAEPDIVTPIGLTFDSRGRLLVVESHTHFRPKNYQGPPADRIRIVEDSDGDGRADKFSSFWEGGTATMNLATHPDGSIYVTARNELYRLRDTDGDGVADQKHILAHLETKADYPHNGLSGLAIAADGTIWFGIGENLGGTYTLIGADGTKFIDDTTNGGLIFHCDAEGRGVKVIARGFWNPFGLAFDRRGNLFMDDNDPDGRPPCRLIHVVPGGDYGYQYRYGRSGQHPLNGWEGELPGTLPPITGTGEAPCQMLFHGDKLLVASWGDHRVESYTLTESGATFSATMRPIITGGEDFRPVGLALAQDGTLYVSDWALKDYPLHGKGRIWRVRGLRSEAGPLRGPGPATGQADGLRTTTTLTTLISALRDPDPFVAQAAQYGLSRQAELMPRMAWDSLQEPSQRIGVLAAMRYSGNTAFLDDALRDPDSEVRLMAVRWIADEKLVEFRPRIERAMGEPVLTPRLFAAYVATLERLDDQGLFIGKPGTSIAQYLLPKLREASTPAAVKVLALQMLPPDAKLLPVAEAASLAHVPDENVQLEAVRWLCAVGNEDAMMALLAVAGDRGLSSPVIAEAVVGLAANPQPFRGLLESLAQSNNPGIRAEALRALGSKARPEPDRPPLSDASAWLRQLDRAPGDPLAGRRLFFHPAGPGCYRCHRVDGRGADIGPDLTGIGRRTDRPRLLESILDPGKEIAPRFSTWSVTLTDGRTLTAFLVGENGGKHRYADATGQVTEVEASQVIDRKALPVSIMPVGLVHTMTDQELRDLLAYLTAP